MPSVTEVLSVLNRGFHKANPGVLAAAAERGSKIHAFILGTLKFGWMPGPEPEIKPYVDTYFDWHERHIAEVLAVEYELHYLELDLVGHVDMVARFHGERVHSVMDLKVVANVDWIVGLQLSGYEMLAEKEWPRRQWGVRRAIRLGPDGVRVIPFADPQDRAEFLHCLSLFNHSKKMKGVL